MSVIKTVDGVKTVANEEMCDAEIREYIHMTYQRCPNAKIDRLEFAVDGDYVSWNVVLAYNPKFERLRRVTGYLSGTLDRWNDAKKAEERDRVKHGVGNK